MCFRTRRPLWCLAIVAVVAIPAAAQVRPGETHLEVYAGAYESGVEDLDADPTYGLRFGYNFNRRAEMQVAAGSTRTTGSRSIATGVTRNTSTSSSSPMTARPCSSPRDITRASPARARTCSS